MVQRMLFNVLDKDENKQLLDLSLRERAVLAPLLVLIVLIGVYPAPFLDRMSPAVDALLENVEMRAAMTPAEDVEAPGGLSFVPPEPRP